MCKGKGKEGPRDESKNWNHRKRTIERNQEGKQPGEDEQMKGHEAGTLKGWQNVRNTGRGQRLPLPPLLHSPQPSHPARPALPSIPAWAQELCWPTPLLAGSTTWGPAGRRTPCSALPPTPWESPQIREACLHLHNGHPWNSTGIRLCTEFTASQENVQRSIKATGLWDRKTREYAGAREGIGSFPQSEDIKLRTIYETMTQEPGIKKLYNSGAGEYISDTLLFRNLNITYIIITFIFKTFYCEMHNKWNIYIYIYIYIYIK